MSLSSNLTKSEIKEWWSNKRYIYNLGLILSGIIAFILYVIVGVNFIMPYDEDFDITLFTIVFQGISYLVMIVFANLFYSLGVINDLNNNKENTNDFRKNLFNLGFWFSVSLPFLAPLWLLISYFLEFY
ncbi:hypothetical protein AR438_16995 [Chryseobacterium aquaticum]|jgi:hypothetical protein|uniref:Uncharacterized protein n=1 Tax=Chryseobacterium aquaticum TaxID=452084 RepID=A0A0Q3P2R0_9FLAO|nr:hypothetical protein [Chryseobacterium aquaticum]KQK24326.1 hypothetical protein AR438_16995 [Chryseobacterium aquaticum]